MEQQVSVFVKSYYEMGETAKETYSFLKVAFCDEVLSYPTVSEWYRCFKKCLKIVGNDHSSGCRLMSQIHGKMQSVLCFKRKRAD
jgi:hypothetical protein